MIFFFDFFCCMFEADANFYVCIYCCYYISKFSLPALRNMSADNVEEEENAAEGKLGKGAFFSFKKIVVWRSITRTATLSVSLFFVCWVLCVVVPLARVPLHGDDNAKISLPFCVFASHKTDLQSEPCLFVSEIAFLLQSQKDHSSNLSECVSLLPAQRRASLLLTVFVFFFSVVLSAECLRRRWRTRIASASSRTKKVWRMFASTCCFVVVRGQRGVRQRPTKKYCCFLRRVLSTPIGLYVDNIYFFKTTTQQTKRNNPNQNKTKPNKPKQIADGNWFRRAKSERQRRYSPERVRDRDAVQPVSRIRRGGDRFDSNAATVRRAFCVSALICVFLVCVFFFLLLLFV